MGIIEIENQNYDSLMNGFPFFGKIRILFRAAFIILCLTVSVSSVHAALSASSFQEGLSVNPASLNLSGFPGDRVLGSLTISGEPPFSVRASPGFITLSGNTATYGYDIYAKASKGQRKATIWVNDYIGNTIGVPVTITIGEDLSVDSASINLNGNPGQNVTASVIISGGKTPYSASVISGEGSVSLLDNTATYSYEIFDDAEVGQKFKATVEVKDAKNNSVRIQFETIVKSFNPFEKLSLTPNQKQVAGTLQRVYPLLKQLPNPTPGQEQLASRIDAIIASAESDPKGAENAIAQITPDEAGSQAILTTKTSVQQMSNVQNRLFALRAGATGFNMSGLSFGIPAEAYLAGMVTDVAANKILGDQAGLKHIELMKNLGVFVNGSLSFGNRDTTTNQSGFDFDTLGVTAGIDYRFTEDLVLGVAAGYADTGIDYNSSGGDLDIDAWSASLYGNYYVLEKLYLDAIVSFGWSDYDQKRKVAYFLQNDIPIAADQKSDYSGDQYSVSIGAGYDFDFDALKLSFNGRISYLELDVDGYREKDPADTGLNLNIRDQETDSFTTTLGLHVSYNLNTNMGIFIPKMAAEWVHEFGDDSFFIEGSFVNDPNPINPTVFFIETDDPARDYYRLSPGMTMVFPHGISSFINFDCLLGYQDFESYNVSFNVSFEF